MNKVLAWARLTRVSNLPTVWSNVLMGLLVQAGKWPLVETAAALAIATLMYSAGMVLNDVCDVERDRVERPERVLPSGVIPVAHAQWVALSLLLAGLVLSGLAGYLPVLTQSREFTWMPLVLGALLLFSIVAYDMGGKATLLGPLLMGLCRSWNILLAMSIGALAADGSALSGASVLIAVGIGGYVSGITLFARNEHRISPRGQLALATAVVLGGIALLLALPHFDVFDRLLADGNRTIAPSVRIGFSIVLAVMLVPVLRHLLEGILDPRPQTIQLAVVAGLQALILIDAALCFLMAPAHPGFAVFVVALLVPRLWLGRMVAST